MFKVSMTTFWIEVEIQSQQMSIFDEEIQEEPNEEVPMIERHEVPATELATWLENMCFNAKSIKITGCKKVEYIHEDEYNDMVNQRDELFEEKEELQSKLDNIKYSYNSLSSSITELDELIDELRDVQRSIESDTDDIGCEL